MVNLHEGFESFALLLRQLNRYVFSITSFKREAILLVIHNLFMYHIINRFKHLAQASINRAGPVNTFCYVPLVYKAPAVLQAQDDVHVVLKSTTWMFFETLFSHHLALLLPFILALLVPRCKLFYVSSLVIVSNFTMCICFVYAICQLLALSSLSMSLDLLPILFVGPVVQLLLVFRFMVRMLFIHFLQMAEGRKFRQEPQSLRDELRMENIGLQHAAPEDFFRSQWQSGATSSGFLTYRWVMTAFFGSGFVSCLIIYFKSGRWLIYLTHWGFMLCSLTSLTGAILVSKYNSNPSDIVNQSGVIKWYWAFYWINLILTNIISITYWTAIYPQYKSGIPHFEIHPVYDVWMHGVPPLLFTLDHMIVAHPSRLLHFVYPLAFGLFYGAFSYVYYKLGGVDPLGREYIYDILDYSEPYKALGTIGQISVLLLICSTFQYGLYRLRTFVARKLGKLL